MEYYIQNTKTGKVKKTKDINEATQFYNVNKAMRKISTIQGLLFI